MNNDAFVKNVASRLIEQIRNGTAPWQKPWRAGTSFLPFNPTNGTRYKGINVVNLLSRGYSDSRWMTYRQAQTKGYQVRRGEKGTQVQYWRFDEERKIIDANGELHTRSIVRSTSSVLISMRQFWRSCSDKVTTAGVCETNVETCRLPFCRETKATTL